jgi:hypothetical protein
MKKSSPINGRGFFVRRENPFITESAGGRDFPFFVQGENIARIAPPKSLPRNRVSPYSWGARGGCNPPQFIEGIHVIEGIHGPLSMVPLWFEEEIVEVQI